MQPVFETCGPREEVLSGRLTDDMFAAKLDRVLDGEAPDVYQDPNVFFARTFPTEGLKALLVMSVYCCKKGGHGVSCAVRKAQGRGGPERIRPCPAIG